MLLKLLAGPGGSGDDIGEWVPAPVMTVSVPDGVTLSTVLLSPSAMYTLPAGSTATPRAYIVKLVAGPGGSGELITEWVPRPANIDSAPEGVTFSTPLLPSAMYMLPLESKAAPAGLIWKLVAGAVGVVDGVEPPPPAIFVIVAAVVAYAGTVVIAMEAEARAAAHIARRR